jgi:hypothetical protein
LSRRIRVEHVSGDFTRTGQDLNIGGNNDDEMQKIVAH